MKYIQYLYGLLNSVLLFEVRLLMMIVKCIYDLRFKRKLIIPKVIVNVDGGICSQMHQYLIGEIFRKKGYIVEYSLNFYKKRSCVVERLLKIYEKKDESVVQGNIRNFDLLKAFPGLSFKKVSKWNDFLYRNCYFYWGKYPASQDVSWTNLSAPIFLGGYYYDPKDMYKGLFQETFKVSIDVMNAIDRHVYENIPEESIAVHVRRGDLSVYHEAYGVPVTIDYFRKAISFFYELLKNPVFYFFSDDLEYVRTKLLPSLPKDISCILLSNGEDKGYIDLFLISRCTHQITSKGTLGKFGALLNITPGKKIVVFENDPQLFYFNRYSDYLICIS